MKKFLSLWSIWCLPSLARAGVISDAPSLADVLLIDRHQVAPRMKLPVAENVGDAVQWSGRRTRGEEGRQERYQS